MDPISQESDDDTLTQVPPDEGDVYSALLGGKFDPQAVGSQLNQQGLLGLLLQSSGDKAIAPVGQTLSEETGQQLEGLSRTRQAMAQLGAEQAYRQAQLGAESAYHSADLDERAREDELNREQTQGLREQEMNLQREIAGLGAGPAAATSLTGTPLTGAAFLGTLPANVASQVKALAEGRQPFPSGYALTKPYWRNMLGYVSQYDPTFDAVNYNSRAALRKNFTSGTMGQNIASLNMALQHMNDLYDSTAGTSNVQIPLIGRPLSATLNEIRRLGNEPGINRYDAQQNVVATEVPRALRGAGIAEADIDRFLQNLSPSGNPKSAMTGMAQLLNDRLGDLATQYNTGLGTTEQPLPTLYPQSRAILNRLLGNTGGGKQVVRTGTGPGGKRFAQYSDGSIGPAP